MKILLALDGSRYSEAALGEVVARSWPSTSIVRVLSVIHPYTPPATEFVVAGATLADVRQQQAAEAEALITRAATALKGVDIPVETVVREGDPRSVIVDEAEQWGADLIVVGSHGRTWLKGWLLGSVAQSVVAHAPCSVEVARARKPVTSHA